MLVLVSHCTPLPKKGGLTSRLMFNERTCRLSKQEEIEGHEQEIRLTLQSSLEYTWEASTTTTGDGTAPPVWSAVILSEAGLLYIPTVVDHTIRIRTSRTEIKWLL